MQKRELAGGTHSHTCRCSCQAHYVADASLSEWKPHFPLEASLDCGGPSGLCSSLGSPCHSLCLRPLGRHQDPTYRLRESSVHAPYNLAHSPFPGFQARSFKVLTLWPEPDKHGTCPQGASVPEKLWYGSQADQAVC